MNAGCPHEPHVIRAAATNAWSESLRAHAAGCPDCAAAASAAPWMQELSIVDERPRTLPDPAVLWLKAKLLSASADVERVSRPITRLQMAAYAVVAACWAALLTWKWAALQAWAHTFTPHGVILGASRAETAAMSGTLMLVLVVLASATAAVAMHTILAEE